MVRRHGSDTCEDPLAWFGHLLRRQSSLYELPRNSPLVSSPLPPADAGGTFPQEGGLTTAAWLTVRGGLMRLSYMRSRMFLSGGSRFLSMLFRAVERRWVTTGTRTAEM